MVLGIIARSCATVNQTDLTNRAGSFDDTDILIRLIEMSAHRPEFKDYVIGPNAARVLRHATQSVFVARDRGSV